MSMPHAYITISISISIKAISSNHPVKWKLTPRIYNHAPPTSLTFNSQNPKLRKHNNINSKILNRRNRCPKPRICLTSKQASLEGPSRTGEGVGSELDTTSATACTEDLAMCSLKSWGLGFRFRAAGVGAKPDIRVHMPKKVPNKL